MIRTNLHTHSVFCDGKNTIEEMVKKAIELGFYSLGFSSHCFTGLEEDPCGMSKEGTLLYLKEIDRVQELYPEIILFKGIEEEAIKPYPTDGFDYSILSSHFSRTPNGLRPIDYKKEVLSETLEIMGYDKFFEDYFDQLTNSSASSPIIAHFDLYTKFDEKEPLFNTIPDIAYDTINYFIARDKIFEVNTGAIGRGYRTKPYPSLPLLKHIKEKGGYITISSDCHNMEYLNVYFKEAREMLLTLGFKSQRELTREGFKEVEL